MLIKAGGDLSEEVTWGVSDERLTILLVPGSSRRASYPTSLSPDGSQKRTWMWLQEEREESWLFVLTDNMNTCRNIWCVSRLSHASHKNINNFI